MGSIHERLQTINNARELIDATRLEEENALKIKKNELSHNPDLLYNAQMEQYEKFKKLEELGIIEMIKDATEGLEVNLDEPKTAEQEEFWSMRILSKAERLNSISSEATKEWVEKVKGNKNTLNKMTGYQYWGADIQGPEVTDDIEFDATLKINIKKTSKVYNARHQVNHTVPVELISLSFDGNNLKLQGANITFDGVILDENGFKKIELENAFVQAFDSPQKLERSWANNFGNDQLIRQTS